MYQFGESKVKSKTFTRILSVIILAFFLACVSLMLLPPKSSSALANSNYDTSIQEVSRDLREIPQNPPANPSLKTFGNFAWKTFIALNWPANCTTNLPLEPLEDKEIGQAPNLPRIWEFYPYPEMIFLPRGATPDIKPDIPTQCQPHGKLIARKLNLTELGSNPIFSGFGPILPIVLSNWQARKTGIELPFGYVLVDRQGNYVLSEPRMNFVEFTQIEKNGWYSADKLEELKFNNNVSGNSANPFQLICSAQKENGYPTKNNPLVPCRDNETEGAIEIKAAWMVLPKNANPRELPNPKVYYTTKRTLFVETPEHKIKPVMIPVALIGFHILHKTSLNGWIWSTFEHINNAPDDPNMEDDNGYGCYTPPDLNYYNLYDPKSSSRVNTPLASTPYLWRDEFPHAVTEDKYRNIVEQRRSNITRQVCIPHAIEALNKDWQETLKGFNSSSVWQHYQLIGVQWLDQPSNPYGNGRNVLPKQMLNVALEPYPQKVPQDFLERFPDAGFSCVSCHTAATLPDKRTKADFSFLMNHAQYSSIDE
ncbi:MAG: hypothetical protein J7647_02135 [Cyanobacteria bacterium SBLK]|nr:hypothetical protein [Cyanobacteria bacterium SBLK]